MIIAGVVLLLLHTLDGRDVYVNPTHIVSVAEVREEHDPRKLLTGKVRCVVTLSNGKFLTVVEDCASVRRRLDELGR